MGEAGRLVVPVALAANRTLATSLTFVAYRSPDAVCTLRHASTSIIIALGAFRHSWARAQWSRCSFGMNTFSFVTVWGCDCAWCPLAVVTAWPDVKLALCLFRMRSAASRGSAVESHVRRGTANTFTRLYKPGPDTVVHGSFTVLLMVMVLRAQV